MRNVRNRGLTIAEVLVASAIMIVISGIVLAVFRTTYKLHGKGENKSDLSRRINIAAARLRQEMRGARIVSPASGVGSVLVYQLPLMEDGLMKLGPDGSLQWGTPQTMRLKSGELTVEVPSESPRVLTRLSESSSLEFDRNDDNLLIIRLVAKEGDDEYRVPMTFYLGNQP